MRVLLCVWVCICVMHVKSRNCSVQFSLEFYTLNVGKNAVRFVALQRFTCYGSIRVNLACQICSDFFFLILAFYLQFRNSFEIHAKLFILYMFLLFSAPPFDALHLILIISSIQIVYICIYIAVYIYTHIYIYTYFYF